MVATAARVIAQRDKTRLTDTRDSRNFEECRTSARPKRPCRSQLGRRWLASATLAPLAAASAALAAVGVATMAADQLLGGGGGAHTFGLRDAMQR